MPRIRLILRGAVFLALVTTACGDGDSDSLSFEEWQERTNEVCAEYEPRVQERTAAQPEVESAADLVSLVDAIGPLNVEYREALVSVGVPEDRADEVERLYDDLQSVEDLAFEARDAAEAEGLDAAVPLMQELQATVDEINQTAQDLGVPACDSR